MTFSFLSYQKKNEEIIAMLLVAAQDSVSYVDYHRPPMIEMCNDLDKPLALVMDIS